MLAPTALIDVASTRRHRKRSWLRPHIDYMLSLELRRSAEAEHKEWVADYDRACEPSR
jgi:hypothetical protein